MSRIFSRDKNRRVTTEAPPMLPPISHTPNCTSDVSPQQSPIALIMHSAVDNQGLSSCANGRPSLGVVCSTTFMGLDHGHALLPSFGLAQTLDTHHSTRPYLTPTAFTHSFPHSTHPTQTSKLVTLALPRPLVYNTSNQPLSTLETRRHAHARFRGRWPWQPRRL